MYRAAAALDLGGFVRNDEQGIFIEVEGEVEAVGRFLDGLPQAAPAVARIESVETSTLALRGERQFRISPSGVGSGASAASIPADLAPCDDCLRELDDPSDRRHRYPFINCTACGPRFTIVRRLPYDRHQTTMASFTLCPACRREYEDPLDRRFHAEPNACAACGPTVTLITSEKAPLRGDDALRRAGQLLAEGLIVAVKGAGGFLLAVDATSVSAVARLRARKRRPSKPLAVMARTLRELERLVELEPVTREALRSRARPIVLARARVGSRIAFNIAPRLHELGVFLPSTPLQHLLLGEGPPVLVMTSGNVSEEPIARDNDHAIAQLEGIADAFLCHDREIHTRADDSVVRVVCGETRVLRRARGLVPDPIQLPFPVSASSAPVLAVGAEQRTTVCLIRGQEAILSQHLGDLQHPDTFSFFSETIDKLTELAGAAPGALAHDLHPDYRSTRWAGAHAEARGLPLLAVQHHHAHVAACMVENGRADTVIGVAFDGTGLGDDGTLWGGEFMLANFGGYRREGHLQPLALPGGEAAIHQPWRAAAAALHDAGESAHWLADAIGVTRERMEKVGRLCASPRLAPRASGAGRWFDAIAALCGLRREIDYDGQAAIELEAIAGSGAHEPYELAFGGDHPFVIDLRPTTRAVAADRRRGTSVVIIAARFHQTLACAIARACRRVRAAHAVETVALSGGCFQNRLLTVLAKHELETLGFEVLLHRRVPAHDGGLALGQAAVASFQLSRSGRSGGDGSTCA
jgi:hydrogenase maturation protein HypF